METNVKTDNKKTETVFNPDNNDDLNETKQSSVMSYDPYENNSVLIVKYTTDNILMLLKNGIILSWGNNTSTLGRNIKTINEAASPSEILIPCKIIEIVTGRDHVIARGENKVLFSWGKNTKGQLGIPSIDPGPNSEIHIPVLIEFFSNLPTKQIFAGGDSSFAISEGGNNLYGWGDNEKGQLGINPSSKMFPVPQLLPGSIATKSTNSLIVFCNKKGNKSYIAEISRPSNIIGESMEYFKNKMLKSQLKELNEQLELLEERENLINRRFSGMLSKEQILQSIDGLIAETTMKIKKINSAIKKLGIEKAEENLKQNDIQIKQQDQTEKEYNINLKNPNLSKEEKDQLEKMGKIIENTNEKTYQFRNKTVRDLLKFQKEKEKLTKKLTIKKAQRKLFKEIKSMASKLDISKENEENLQETKSALDKISQLSTDLYITFFENFQDLTPNSASIAASINASNKNLEELETRLKNEIIIDKGNELGLQTKDLFKSIINLSKQNNGLLDLMLNTFKFYYNYSFENQQKK